MNRTQGPPLYMLSTIKIRAGKMLEFCELMPQVVAIVEAQGWRLMGAFSHLGGRLNVVVDLWQIPDANALPGGIQALIGASEWPDIARGLAETVEDEFLQMMTKLPFDLGRMPEPLG